MPPLNQQIAFIGGGRMAEALIRGLLEHNLVAPANLVVTGPRAERRAAFEQSFGVRVSSNNREAARGADVVILAVKPQVLPAVLRELHGALRAEQLVISIAAGVPLAVLQSGLDHEAVVRGMPNTPSQIGMGMTVWYPATAVSPEQRALAKAILGAFGEEEVSTTEDAVDMATAVSGSGPAYIFLIMEALVDAGVQLGLSQQVAERLVAQTVEGSARFARESGRTLSELRTQVMSPGGTTAAAIDELERGALRTVIANAVRASHERARVLGEEARTAMKDPGD